MSKFKPIEYYKEDMKQHWTRNSYSKSLSDQYGFVIHYGTHYTLEHKGVEIFKFNNLLAAQEVSRVILNDKINRMTVKDVPAKIGKARQAPAIYSNTGYLQLTEKLK